MKCVGGCRGSTPDPAGGAYDALSDPLIVRKTPHHEFLATPLVSGQPNWLRSASLSSSCSRSKDSDSNSIVIMIIVLVSQLVVVIAGEWTTSTASSQTASSISAAGGLTSFGHPVSSHFCLWRSSPSEQRRREEHHWQLKDRRMEDSRHSLHDLITRQASNQ